MKYLLYSHLKINFLKNITLNLPSLVIQFIILKIMAENIEQNRNFRMAEESLSTYLAQKC